ncbi:hypothetical protein BDF21DRAFT_413855 [Thamnidium elegans]|nr:hypothetical protein BDF21DRAFT_413855 [Thamnidium elegans]
MFYVFRLRKTPRKDLSEELKEQELSTRFVKPLLSGLFDDPDNDVMLRFTGLITVGANSFKLSFSDIVGKSFCVLSKRFAGRLDPHSFYCLFRG